MKFGFAFASVVAAKPELKPYPGYTGPLTVTGSVGGFLYGEDAYVWYQLSGLEADCAETPAGVANACGIHIHEGKTCDDASAVGGHYYDTDTITSDPWSPVTYTASAEGTSKGKASATVGAGQDINGRAIVVHDKTGARVACALVEGKLQQRKTELVPYPGYTGPLTVTGHVGGYLFQDDAYVWYTLSGLEKECATTPEGVSNACGIHIHEGKTCDDAAEVGGHYFNKDTVTSDPWSPLVYKTGRHGSSRGNVKASIGEGQDIDGRAIVVHDQTGARVACALVSKFPVVAAEASSGLPSYCPGSSASIHANARLTATATASCDVVKQEIKDRLAGKNGWVDQHNGGTYTEVSPTNGATISATRLTGDGKYTDKMNWVLSGSGNSCSIQTCSESQVFSVADFGTNYCNTKLPICGSDEGCKVANADFSTAGEKVDKSGGAGSGMSNCIASADVAV